MAFDIRHAEAADAVAVAAPVQNSQDLRIAVEVAIGLDESTAARAAVRAPQFLVDVVAHGDHTLRARAIPGMSLEHPALYSAIAKNAWCTA